MYSFHITHQQIAAILSFEVDAKEVKTLLSLKKVNWDNIVKTASSQLVLTTVYCRLKQKSLLDSLPKDLEEYLEELTAINRNRNTTLLKEIEFISTLFKNHNINHVFVKGAALLASNQYKDFGERMIGDIDVLVQANQTKKAYQLLEENNYYPLEVEPERKHITHRHLNRLIPRHGLAAVEIHHTLLARDYKNYLNPINILNSKQLINGVYVPSNLELLHHNILAYQINDFGNIKRLVNFKNAFDSLIILRQQQELNFNNLLKDTVFKNYFLVLKPFFKDIPDWELSNLDRFKLSYHRRILKTKPAYILHKTLVNSYILAVNLFKHLKIALQHRSHILFFISKLKKSNQHK